MCMLICLLVVCWFGCLRSVPLIVIRCLFDVRLFVVVGVVCLLIAYCL